MKPAALQITNQQSSLKSGLGTGDDRQRWEFKRSKNVGLRRWDILVSIGLKSTSESMDASSEE